MFFVEEEKTIDRLKTKVASLEKENAILNERLSTQEKLLKLEFEVELLKRDMKMQAMERELVELRGGGMPDLEKTSDTK